MSKIKSIVTKASISAPSVKHKTLNMRQANGGIICNCGEDSYPGSPGEHILKDSHAAAKHVKEHFGDAGKTINKDKE